MSATSKRFDARAAAQVYGASVVLGAIAPRVVHRRFYRSRREAAVMTVVSAASIYTMRFVVVPAFRKSAAVRARIDADLEEELGREPTIEERIDAYEQRDTSSAE